MSVVPHRLRVAYYARNVVRDLMPQGLFRSRLHACIQAAPRGSEERIAARVGYCNRLAAPFAPGPEAVSIGDMPLHKTFYYYDLKEHARYFDRSLKLDYIFGDLVHVPERPTIVKSRPITPDNANSVLMKLDKLRHFHVLADPVPFEAKRPVAVWRGAANHPRRIGFVEACARLPGTDIGFTNPTAPDAWKRPPLSMTAQMGCRYILSVQGYDVATNLKWIFASNSLCIMPAPDCETWFMECSLVPGVHYAELKPDYSNLAELIEGFEARPDEAKAIVANAQAHFRQFTDPVAEQVVSLLVLYKYLVLSGQIDRDPAITSRFGEIV